MMWAGSGLGIAVAFAGNGGGHDGHAVQGEDHRGNRLGEQVAGSHLPVPGTNCRAMFSATNSQTSHPTMALT
jgi:hypothetical protein